MSMQTKCQAGGLNSSKQVCTIELIIKEQTVTWHIRGRKKHEGHICHSSHQKLENIEIIGSCVYKPPKKVGIFLLTF